MVRSTQLCLVLLLVGVVCAGSAGPVTAAGGLGPCPGEIEYLGPLQGSHNTGLYNLAQSITPTENFTLRSIELALTSAASCDITVYVQDNLSFGAFIFTQATIPTRTSAGVSWYHFDVPDVVLNANTTYYIRVGGCSGATETMWHEGTANSYAGGSAWIDAVSSNFDFLFRMDGFRTSIPKQATLVHTVTPNTNYALFNVGQRSTFTATLNPATPAAASYQWCVDGEVLKDYSELIQSGLWSVTPMGAGDYQGSSLSFYWKPDANQIHPSNNPPPASGSPCPNPRTVTVLITRTDGTQCYGEGTYCVLRNTEQLDVQPVDFYTRSHPVPSSTKGAVMAEYANWRSANFGTSASCTPADYGERHFSFHASLISRYTSWRREFGYGLIPTWDPGVAIPTDYEVKPGGSIDPVNRSSTAYVLYPKPSYFAIPGDPGNPRTVENYPAPNQNIVATLGCSLPVGQTRLFGANGFTSRNQLGAAIVAPWHDVVKQRVGGLNGTINSYKAPRDELFWRLHRYLNGIDLSYDSRPGHVPKFLDQYPSAMFPYVLDTLFRFVGVFDDTVTGVDPTDLLVNGVAATFVVGSGPGPYVFTGFPQPPLGTFDITVQPGGIQLLDGSPFPGYNSSHRLLTSGGDSDGDGLSNSDEVRLYRTDPLLTDTDGDGESDPSEISQGRDPLDPSSPTAVPISAPFALLVTSFLLAALGVFGLRRVVRAA